MPKHKLIQLVWISLAVVSGSLAYMTLFLAFGAGSNRCYEDTLCYSSNAIAGILFLIVMMISVVSASHVRTNKHDS